jgi:hypothetical protein
MKRFGSFALISGLALLSSLAGCENKSRLDNAVKTDKAEAAPDTANHSGTLEERVARLEKNFDTYGDALDFLQKVYEQQGGQEPDPNAVFAVDVAPDLKLGQVEGSPEALVTIVEAWDFA